MSAALHAAVAGAPGAGVPWTLVLVGVLAVATLVGLAIRRRTGRFRPQPVVTEPDDADALGAALAGRALGEVATFVQISSDTCSICPRVAQVLVSAADAQPGVRHVELRAEENLALVRALDVYRTPTVLLVDAHGTLRSRTSGAVTPAQARSALADLVPDLLRSTHE